MHGEQGLALSLQTQAKCLLGLSFLEPEPGHLLDPQEAEPLCLCADGNEEVWNTPPTSPTPAPVPEESMRHGWCDRVVPVLGAVSPFM